MTGHIHRTRSKTRPSIETDTLPSLLILGDKDAFSSSNGSETVRAGEDNEYDDEIAHDGSDRDLDWTSPKSSASIGLSRAKRAGKAVDCLSDRMYGGRRQQSQPQRKNMRQRLDTTINPGDSIDTIKYKYMLQKDRARRAALRNETLSVVPTATISEFELSELLASARPHGNRRTVDTTIRSTDTQLEIKYKKKILQSRAQTERKRAERMASCGSECKQEIHHAKLRRRGRDRHRAERSCPHGGLRSTASDTARAGTSLPTDGSVSRIQAMTRSPPSDRVADLYPGYEQAGIYRNSNQTGSDALLSHNEVSALQAFVEGGSMDLLEQERGEKEGRGAQIQPDDGGWLAEGVQSACPVYSSSAPEDGSERSHQQQEIEFPCLTLPKYETTRSDDQKFQATKRGQLPFAGMRWSSLEDMDITDDAVDWHKRRILSLRARQDRCRQRKQDLARSELIWTDAVAGTAPGSASQSVDLFGAWVAAGHGVYMSPYQRDQVGSPLMSENDIHALLTFVDRDAAQRVDEETVCGEIPQLLPVADGSTPLYWQLGSPVDNRVYLNESHDDGSMGYEQAEAEAQWPWLTGVDLMEYGSSWNPAATEMGSILDTAADSGGQAWLSNGSPSCGAAS